MTGFASSTAVISIKKEGIPESRVHITMTLKSLNSRFFEANCRLPFALSHLETDLIKEFKAKLIRGNINFTVHLMNPAALTAMVEPSMTTIAGYIQGIKKIQDSFKIPGHVTVADLIQLPSIFETQEQSLDQSTVADIMRSVHTLIESLLATRKKEGDHLARDITTRISQMRGYLAQLEPRAALVAEQKKQHLLQSLKNVSTQLQQETRDAQEVAMYHQLEKIDIHEEIIRFKTHLDGLESIISSPDPEKGKKLDFTLQELFREINTMTSKCADAQISGFAINIKVELEKAREQAQNIV